MADLADIENHRLDALADVVSFSGDLLTPRQERFRLSQGQRGGPALEALDGAVYQVALLGSVLVEDRVALRLADLLDHHLLGALGGDAAEQLRRDDVLTL